jgi:ABC-type uncharacterized transport system substrate-binding protein
MGSLMTVRNSILAALAALALFAAAPANAHPHVWVVARGEIVYGPDGAMQAIRYAWTFDEAFSAFAIQGLDKNNDGKLSRQEHAAAPEHAGEKAAAGGTQPAQPKSKY